MLLGETVRFQSVFIERFAVDPGRFESLLSIHFLDFVVKMALLENYDAFLDVIRIEIHRVRVLDDNS